jgi:1-acyl-sn-glycerol-3-phosphate acyltransferase
MSFLSPSESPETSRAIDASHNAPASSRVSAPPLAPGVSIPVAPSIPRTHGALAQAIGRLWLRAGRWRLAGEVPDVRQAIIIVAPHTSNWDFTLGLAIKFILRLKARWLGKDAIFKSPLGGFFKQIGGIPIDRSAANNVVQASVDAFRATPNMLLVLSPEGTRTARMKWKSGFYHIARGANVPVIPVVFDWGTKVVTFLPPQRMDDSAEVEIARLQALFSGVRGKRT